MFEKLSNLPSSAVKSKSVNKNDVEIDLSTLSDIGDEFQLTAQCLT